MIKIGITGQAGFIGTHLYNTFKLYSNKFECIPFEDSFFQDAESLLGFVKQCNIIVHLAAMNRHNDPNIIYQTNIGLTSQLIAACETAKSAPHIIFSSSTQEEQDNLYGRSKKEGREILEKWAIRNSAHFTGLIIPNVFGPFGNPYYNSVVATFCHQLTHNEQPRIDVDSELKLIYIDELVKKIIQIIDEAHFSHKTNEVIQQIRLEHTVEIKVSKIFQILESYKTCYFDRGEIPSLSIPFNRYLFNTFLTFFDLPSFFPFHLKLNIDNRGSFVETMKLNSGGQISFSSTFPGMTRGNHFHTSKVERFAVIKGKARIEIRRIGTDKILSFELDGNNPSFVDMPVWYTHNITNIGDEELYTIFWINEHYNVNDPDTWFEKV